MWGVTVVCGGCEVQPIYEVYSKGKSGYTGDDIDVLAFRGRIACD